MADDAVTKIKNAVPLDLWDATNDANKIDDVYYYGLTQYYTRMASTTTMVSDKFQIREVSNESQWANIKDYRFKAGETISIYRMQQSTTGITTWDWNENRTLQGATSSLATAILSTSLVALFLTF